MYKKFLTWYRRRKYREGGVLSRFIAKDVRRDVVIVSAARIDDGFVTVKLRTVNVLYVLNGLILEPAFEPARELPIKELWHWTGTSWGGLPDGTSLAERRLPGD